MDTPLENLLATMANAARRDNLSNRDWAQKANVRPETLSRLKLRGDCDLTTLAALANAVDLRVALVPKSKTSLPKQFSREEEEKLLVLCASRSLDLAKWRDGGSAYHSGLGRISRGDTGRAASRSRAPGRWRRLHVDRLRQMVDPARRRSHRRS